MKRRDFITLLGGAAAAWPLAARAQQPERMRRIGIVMPFAKGDSEGEARIRAFKQELAKLGWTGGGNIQFDERWLTDDMDLVRSHAASLVGSNPDIIVASGGRIVPVFMRLTGSIPMVLPGASDPVASGYVASLARPGGNLTGVFLDAPTLCGKWLQYIDDVVPNVCPTDRTLPISIAASAAKLPGCFAAPGRRSCRSNGRPSMSWSSTSRPPRRSA